MLVVRSDEKVRTDSDGSGGVAHSRILHRAHELEFFGSARAKERAKEQQKEAMYDGATQIVRRAVS
jgi:hypothetical protein